MPRTQRKLANSGIYHIVFKGINHEKIFQENSKKRMILKIMLEKMQETELEIFAYCIMPTHAHILIRGKMEEISRFLSRTEITFAMRYNQGKERNGHLFQNRFFSQAIENEVYFWNCIKYIHDNPVKAGLASDPRKYAFSSYTEYLMEKPYFLSGNAIRMVRHTFGTVERFENYEEEYTPGVCFGGDEEEIYWQKRKNIERELEKIESTEIFKNSRGNYQRSKEAKEFAERCGVQQVELFRILQDIEKDTSPE